LPNTRSAAKALRVSERRNLRNRSTKSAVKTFIRKAEQEITDQGDSAAEAVRRAVSALDRAASKGILHPNNAARRKSRLMKKLAALTVAAASPAVEAAAPAPPARRSRAKQS